MTALAVLGLFDFAFGAFDDAGDCFDMRVEGEGALPVQTLSRSDLDNAGVQNASELLDKISANASFGSFNEAGGAGSSFAGFTGASLRGLGVVESERVENQRGCLVGRIIHAVAVGEPGAIERPCSAANQVLDTRGTGEFVVV